LYIFYETGLANGGISAVNQTISQGVGKALK